MKQGARKSACGMAAHIEERRGKARARRGRRRGGRRGRRGGRQARPPWPPPRGVRPPSPAARDTSSRSEARSWAKMRMPSASFSVAIASSFIIQRKRFSSRAILRRGGAGRLRRELRGQRALVVGELAQQLGRDGQPVAAGQRLDLAGVAERGAHHYRLDAIVLVIGVDRRDRGDAGIGLAGVRAAAGLDVPIEDAADERRDEERAGVGVGDRLGEREQQRHVAVDPLALQRRGGLRAFPGRGDLDQNALAPMPRSA